MFAGLVYACRYCGLLGASLRADARARRLDPAIKTSVIHTLWMLREHEAVLASTVERSGRRGLLARGARARGQKPWSSSAEKNNEGAAR